MTEVAAAPVSFAQQGLWYQAELEPGNPAYHVPVVLSLRGALDRLALVAALEAIVARHEILRTTFALDGSELLQVIHPRMSLPFRDEILEGGEEQLRADIREEIHKPFDLVHGPLMRCVLFQRTRHDHAVLLLTMHHLVTDGWSLGVMMKELAAFYRGAPLADLEIQYADFAEWQREQADHAWADQLAYWKERLRGPLPRTEFPADFQAPASPSFEGATETFRIATATLDALREQSRESGSTLFMTLLAAFKVLLFRHTSQDDVVVGSPVASRNRAAIENLVGFFVNTQVLRTSLAGNPTFHEVLRRVRETTLAAWENQDVPFELVTSVLQPERTRDRSPFFQVMFALQNALPTTLDLPGVSVERIDFVTDTAKLALTVITEEIDGELELRMEYSTALFARETIQRIGRRYERLLQAVCANPEGSIDQLTMLPDAELALLDRWEGEGRHFEVAEPLNRRFERQARATPERIAVRWEGQQLSYRQLNAKANQLARHLQSMGVGIETLVGLSLDRSIDLVVGILAILKAGGAYVPLDPSYPHNRLQFVMEDSAVPVVIARSENEAAVKSAPRVVVLDREEQAIAKYADDDLATAAGTTNAAYVIYTSGSTGQPKGVIVTHLNVARLMASTESLFHFGEDDVWTLFHSYAFDFSVWEMWGALLYGGRLLVVPYATSRTPELFHRLLTDEGVTILNQTPSAFYELMEYAPPHSLRYVIFGGEALDVQRLRPWLERHGDEHPQLVNMYGITETTVHVTYSQILSEAKGPRRRIVGDPSVRPGSAIGRPLPDLRVSILDERKQRVPIGIAGEMYVGGTGVARGYLHRDELTAARFLDRGEGRVYRTGDLARWTSSGELEYLGRIDTQVKIRGFRIELGEIEHALRAVDGVRDAVVVAREQRLIAYCMAGSTVTPNTLRASCEQQLPEYMVPSAYVIVDRFPLNANGKLDRDALPDPDLDRDVVHEAYVAPATEVEGKLARIWCEVLQLERVSTTDNFFALGGDSILLLQVAAKAAKAGLKLTRRNLVEHQTIQEIGAVVKTVAPAAPAPARIREVERDDVYALTPLQQGLLFHAAFAPQDDAYIEQLHVELRGLLDLAAFQQAWQDVIARHAVLRTSFVWQSETESRQRVARDVAFNIDVEDWRDAGSEQQSERLTSRLANDRARGFDLSTAPLMRVAIFRVAEDRWVWLWTHHHLILDGWSLTAVAGEVLRCYHALATGSHVQLEQRRPFRDYIDWLAQQDVKAAEAFWRETLDGFAEPTRMLGLQRTDGEKADRGEIESALSVDETSKLQQWARQKQITLSTIVAAAWARLLQTYSGSDDVVFGVTVSGRPAELTGYDQMVGPFINTLPLRVRADRAMPFDAWLRDLQKQHGRVREFEFSRLVDIQRWSSLPAGHSLFDTMVVFENYPVDESLRSHGSDLSFGAVTFVERGHYGLALAAIPGEKLALRLYYDGARFESATAERLLQQLRALLASAASGEIATLSKWTLASRATKGGPLRLDPRSPHELFEEQAIQAPHRTALVLDERSMTYGELDRRANHLANQLRRRGVGPEVIVGLRMERSLESVIAILAVWKAGGAYLPLDPSYPEQRLEHMIEDAGVKIVLQEDDVKDLHAEPAERPRGAGNASNLAYVIYTSGSTGMPKGTLVERKSLTNLAHALRHILSIDIDSRVLQFASLSFDVSVSEIVMALCFGASLHLARREELLPGPDLAELLRERRITHLSIVPSALAVIPAIALPDLVCLVVGGERCPADLLERWSPGRRLINCYGPTEATVCSTYAEYAGGALTIGRAIPNVRTFVLDAAGAPLPVGAPGELYIGGAGVARGYVARPELTAERFGGGLYRTGDLVRERSDGNLEFIGRADDQVKVRGHRIEPAEIAHVLRQRGGLRDAAVIVRDGRLIAYCVAESESTAHALRSVCVESLPEFMVPSAYVFIDAIPLTASGKIDRDALPALDPDHDVARDAFVAPSNEVETALAKAWSDVLGLATVGVHDNFFEIGGDSILSLQVVARAHHAGIEVTPRQVFQHPTIAELARVARSATVAEPRREPLASHPLTPIQRWFFEQDLLHPEQWNQAVLVEVAPSVNDETLARAIEALAQHHDAFRSRFDGERQRYAGRGLMAFERVALPADIERHADDAHAGLDLANGPLARAVHFTGEGRSLLLIVMHHLIVDGVSWRVLLDDLSRLCRGEQLQYGIAFGEWAQRLDAFANDAAIDVGYWLALDGREHEPLPVDMPREGTANRAGSIDIVEMHLDASETDALLRRVPLVYRTKVNDILLAAFATAMRDWTGRDAIWVNLEGHGREALLDDVDLSRTVGWFTSLFPLRLTATGGRPGALLRSIKEQLRSIPDNGVGFGIARYLRDDTRLKHLPSPELSFNYLGQFDQAEAASGVFRLAEGPVGRGQHRDERRLHLIDVVASVQSRRFSVQWHYSRELHHRATIEGVAQRFIASLRETIDHCVRIAGSAEDIYPLTPMQQGLLFHALQSAEADLYVEQLRTDLHGRLDVDAFERAWLEVIRRHEVFRTSFVWDGLEEPLQRVSGSVTFRVERLDWRDAADAAERIERYAAEDRQCGIALDKAPMFRVALIRFGDERWHLIWTHHHILLDGWSMNLVVREVLDAYRAVPQSKRPRRYRDYIEWLGRQNNEAAQKYWTRTLSGFTAATKLQLVERSTDDDLGSGQAELCLTALETRRLQSWTRRNRITLNTLIAGAWARLLQTFSGSRDVVFGVTLSGRPSSLAGSDEMIGLFINTLPFRAGDATGVPLAAWLQDIQSRQTELRDFEFSRLVDVQRWSDLPPGQALFDTLLAFDNYPVDKSFEQRFGDLDIRDARLAERTHYALALSVAPSEEIRIRALYDNERFGAEPVEQLLRCFRTLLLSAAAGKVHTTSEWSLLSDEEERSVLDRAGSEAPAVIDECIGSWFSRIAASSPDAIALTFEGRNLTYGEVERRSNQLAWHLHDRRVGPESLVGISMERSPDLVIGILGILKAGGAYVPLDPSYPAERLRFIADDSRIEVTVTRSTLEAIADERTDAPIVDVRPGNAAYVIYTSGSTGQPKGCIVTHANVSRLMKQTEPIYSFDREDVWTLFHSAAFDFSVWEMWGALLYGGRLVIVPYAVSRSPEDFYQLLMRERVTVLNQTPSAFRQLMAVDDRVRASLDLRYVIFGGEALQLESLRGWFERHGDQKPLLVNMYGITETTVHVTYHRLRSHILRDPSLRSGSIGQPIADLKLYVLDPYQRPVPDGAVGELYVAGPGLSRGYLRRPELTAERMPPNPFGPGRLYRTGDLARRHGDDDLEYLGRADDQVKVRGFRIEVGEIESVLAQHPSVAEAVVVLRQFGGEDKRLVAYVAARGGVRSEELRAFLSEQVPEYMVPAAFVMLDAMPLTSNGKINRAALPEPAAASDAAHAAPRTEAERVLAEIWSDVLGVARVGIHDNFFALGGDSIRSIEILSRARAAGFAYSFQQLFVQPTIAGLAAAGEQSEATPHDALPPMSLAGLPDDVEDAYPLTRLQLGMFFHSDFESGATAYHDVMTYHLRAVYDGTRFATALATLASRHPILRTSFDLASFDEPLQLVHRHAAIPLDETDLRGATDQDRAISAWVGRERARRFDLDAAPLLRVHVHRRTDDAFQLSLSFHHAILDGWSVATFLAELFRAYLGLALAESPATSFRDFVALERAAGDSASFWKEFLLDATPKELPSLQQQEVDRSVRQQRIDIEDATSSAIKALADAIGVPIRSVLLAAHVRALGHIANDADVVTGLVTNGRPDAAGGDRILGLFLNTVPFRMRLPGGTWADLVRETFATEQRIAPHRRYPLADIQQGDRLFDTDFNFVHFHILDDVLALGGVESLGADGYEETNFTLAVNFSWYGNPGRLAGALDYDPARLTGEQAQEYARIYAAILEAMARHPQNGYDTYALSETPQFEPLDTASVGLHELIADGCATRYPELLLASDKLANVLRAKGVGPDVIVGVALHSGIDRVIALLGIVKAGGAYLPLDPDHPAKRLAFVIEDSAIAHVVTRPGVLPDGLEVSHVIDVDSRGEGSMPRVDVRPDNLAYVLYTSGSTGKPKGVAITHHALVNHMLWMQREYPLTPADVVFQKTPFTFDASVWEFWAPLIAGASLCVAKAGGVHDPAYLIDTIREERVTILQVVPTLLEALLAEPAFRQCRSLRRVFVGGEPLSADLVRRFHDALPDADLVNLYGPTETAIDATSHCFKRDEVERFVPIGKPISNVRAYVLNDALRFVPAGTEGDLYLAGDALGRGYLGRAAMTAASFVADPYGVPGTRMYRTGDRARWLPGDVLEFRGRADQQIKVRGHRVELGEVEAALLSHPSVGQAVASVIDGRLVAYIVARSEVEPAMLREHLRLTLPDPMVPSFFIRMERLPMTASGKVDRRALPAPGVTDARARAEYVEASTEAESAVVAAWQAVLRLPRVGVHDDFFELGGDSIASLRIASRLRQEGWKITPKVILEQHTVARVAAAIERGVSAPLQAAEVAGPVDLLPAQRAFFGQQLPNPHHWNQSLMLDVPADFSVDAFRQALDAIARRHDAFRIRFTTSGAQAYADQPTMIPLDLTNDVSRVQASLDITNGPLMRAAFFDGHLLLVAHHLVVDAVSWRILLDDLAIAYEQATRSEPIRLHDPTTSLRTWAARLQAHAATADPSPWLALASTNPVALPARASSNVEADARSIVATLDDPPARRLNDLLLAALAATITGWTGGDTLWVDVEGHGREDVFDGIDVSRTVGWFTSVFPMALRRSEPVPAVPNNGLDFGVLRDFSPDDSVRARLATLPPREISFNYLGRFDTPVSGPFRPSSQGTGPDHDQQAPRRYLIDVNARVIDGRLAIEWTYAGRAFDEHTIRSLSDAFVTNLRSVAAGDEIAALSPLQEGLLFHAMDDEQPGVYVQQLTALLEGSPDPVAFECAWNRAIERHAALRTSFHRRELRPPVQIIHRHARCTPLWLDWRSAADRERAWETLLREDRAKGIDIENPPLMRLTIVRETDHQWRLLWTHHHLILDGWSLPLVMNDVVAFYREESEGTATSMEPAPSHAELIRFIERRDRRAGESFWREMLRGFDQPNAFALVRPAAAEDVRFDDVERVFSSEFTARLAALAQSLHVTLNTVIQSMWAVVTSTYSRQQDVVFGVTMSGRPAELAGADRTAGLFINTLPIRVDVAPERSIAGLLSEVQRTQSAMSPFEQTPLVDVQRASGVRGRALFESIFVFENYPLGQSLSEAPLRDFAVRDARSIEWTHYPLTCFATPGFELRVKLVYDTARFERRAIERMLEYAADVLEGFVARPGEAIGGVAAVRVPQQTVERKPLALFHERFGAQAKQSPDRRALAFADTALTYRELDEKSNRLANELRQSGLGTELVAGIFMDRSPEMMIALLAIMKAGGAYLPLDPRFPAARVAMTIEDATPLLILTQEHLAARLPESKARVIRIDAGWPEIERESSEAPQIEAGLESSIDPASLAYVIFTSGSTGRPKGVEVSHSALTNLLHSFEDRPGMTAADVLLAVTTLSFDIAALELFLPIMCGATVVIASAEDAVDGERLAALLEQHRVTVMQATPATWRLLLLAGWRPPRSLRIWCGGEAMPPELAENLRVNGSELWNVYGPTETTIWSAIHPVADRDDARLIGTAIANTTLTVVDANLNAVPIGVQGELLIGGDGVARGYRNRPALTAEKFVPDPTASMAGARAYRTGDQVRMRHDGALEFLGRDDAQVKIRGFRVELGEIEAAIRAIEGVRDTVVVHRDGRLIAYVVRDERPAENGILTVALRQTLPDYMVPGVWVDLEAIPLTPNRKVDRNALPSPEAVTGESSPVRPRTALEEVLVGVWKETLGINSVGIRDNFFSLGGHSLHAAQIVAWLRRVFQTKIPLRILFEASTVESLAEVLSQHHANTQETAEAVLEIRAMLPEERARRLASRRLREDVVE